MTSDGANNALFHLTSRPEFRWFLNNQPNRIPHPLKPNKRNIIATALHSYQNWLRRKQQQPALPAVLDFDNQTCAPWSCILLRLPIKPRRPRFYHSSKSSSCSSSTSSSSSWFCSAESEMGIDYVFLEIMHRFVYNNHKVEFHYLFPGQKLHFGTRV